MGDQSASKKRAKQELGEKKLEENLERIGRKIHHILKLDANQQKRASIEVNRSRDFIIQQPSGRSAPTRKNEIKQMSFKISEGRFDYDTAVAKVRRMRASAARKLILARKLRTKGKVGRAASAALINSSGWKAKPHTK